MSANGNGRAPERFGLRLTLVVTNAIKIGGLVVGLYQAFQPHPNAVTILLAGFMMMGAQGIEQAALSFIERFFGLEAKAPSPPPQPSEQPPDGTRGES